MSRPGPPDATILVLRLPLSVYHPSAVASEIADLDIATSADGKFIELRRSGQIISDIELAESLNSALRSSIQATLSHLNPEDE